MRDYLHRGIGRPAIVAVVLSLAAVSCGAGAKVDVSARCSLHPTSAKLIVTEGNLIPVNLTKTIGSAAARRLYGVVCKAIVTAPSLAEQKVIHCPAMFINPGRANVVFFVNDHRVDAIEMTITGCEMLQSMRVGALPAVSHDIDNYRTATRAIDRAFNVTDEQFRKQ